MPRGRKRGEPKPKRVSYELLDDKAPEYKLLTRLVKAHHTELRDARIKLAWCTSWRADVDGRQKLGACRRASDLDRELAEHDFVILLHKPFWTSIDVTDHQRAALLDHELCHAGVAHDTTGEPKVDERGRTVFRLVRHNLEEFNEIAERYGLWKRDLEAFAVALKRSRQLDLLDEKKPAAVGAVTHTH